MRNRKHTLIAEKGRQGLAQGGGKAGGGAPVDRAWAKGAEGPRAWRRMADTEAPIPERALDRGDRACASGGLAHEHPARTVAPCGQNPHATERCGAQSSRQPADRGAGRRVDLSGDDPQQGGERIGRERIPADDRPSFRTKRDVARQIGGGDAVRRRAVIRRCPDIAGRLRCAGAPDPDPFEARVEIRRVLHPGDALLHQEIAEHRGRNPEQGPQDHHRVARRDARHPRETANAAAGAHDPQLVLIARMMTKEEMNDSGLARRTGQRGVTRFARAGLQGGTRRQAQTQDAAAHGEPCKPLGGFGGFPAGFGAETMIDDERDAFSTTLAGPGCGEKNESRAVSPSGNTRGEAWRGAERAEPGHGPLEPSGQAGRERGLQRQAARRRAAPICAFSAGEGEENWLFRESSVSHASWFWWIADRELASPSRA